MITNLLKEAIVGIFVAKTLQSKTEKSEACKKEVTITSQRGECDEMTSG